MRKGCLELEVSHVLQSVEPGLNHFPAQPERNGELRRHLVGVVDIERHAVGGVVTLRQLQSQIDAVRRAYKKVGSRVSAGQGLGICRVLAVELQLAARVLVPELVEDVVAILAAEADGVLAVIPGKIIQYLKDFVVDNKRAVGIVTERAQAVSSERNRRNAPALRIFFRERQA